MFAILPHQRFTADKMELALIVAAAYGLRLIGTLLNGRERYRPSAIDGVVLLYFAMHVIASFSSHYLKESLFGLAKNVVYVFAYFLFVWSLQQNPGKRVSIVFVSLIAAALAVSLFGLYQYKIGVAPLATWEDPSIEDKATRIYSTLRNPNLLAGYLIPILPISFAMGIACLFQKNWKKWFAIPFLGTAGIIKIAILLTDSRGAFIALGIEGAALLLILTVWIWREYPKWRWAILTAWIVAPLMAVAVIHFKMPHLEQRFMSIFKGAEHSSNAYRINVWMASLKMLQDNWWLGIGSGNKTFVLAYGLYMKTGLDALGTYSVPLEIGVETGVFGLLAFVWLLVALAARAHRRFWDATTTTQRWLALGAIIAIVGMMGHGLVDTVFFRPQVEFIFWLMVAVIVALPAKEAQKA
jgi:putative inorganic carbon (hco3(-)) transporter